MQASFSNHPPSALRKCPRKRRPTCGAFRIFGPPWLCDRFLKVRGEINAIVAPAFYGVPLVPRRRNDRVPTPGVSRPALLCREWARQRWCAGFLSVRSESC